MARAFGASSRPSDWLVSAAATLTSASARRNRPGSGVPEMGKLSTARCVDAPYSASSGTAISPIESRSIRVPGRSPGLTSLIGPDGTAAARVRRSFRVRCLRARFRVASAPARSPILGFVELVRANGLDVALEMTGDGPPLLLLHGASSGRDDFAAQLPLLGSVFRCYLPDARGHGATRWDAADGFRYGWLVDDALALADALGLGTFHLLGFSMGAATALGLAAARSDRLRSLVLVGVSAEREPRGSVARRLFDPERLAREEPA